MFFESKNIASLRWLESLAKVPLQATTVVGVRCCAQRGPACSASAGANAALIHVLRIDFTYAASGLESGFAVRTAGPCIAGGLHPRTRCRDPAHDANVPTKINLWSPAVRSKPPAVRSKAITLSPIVNAHHGLTILQAS